MKKLMTVIAACVTGLAALADTVALNNVFDATQVDESTWKTGWAGADVLTNAEKAALKTVEDGQVLHIETGNSALSRLVKTDGTPYTATEKVYFDVEANLLGQVLDDVPLSTLPETAKFALFLLDGNLVEEAPNMTNLYAIVRDPTDAQKKALVRLSTTDNQLKALLAGKARVTIQGYKNVLSSGTCMGFRVYLGGEIASEGGTQTYVQPLYIAALYSISADNVITWTDTFVSENYLKDALISTLSDEMTRKTVLLSCVDSNAEVEKFDLVGNADISTVTITDSDFAFIPAETAQAKVTLKDVTITSVEPADAYANGIVTKDCTITVSSDKPIINAKASQDGTLTAKGNNQWEYKFASGNDIAFTGLDAAATVTINGEATPYATFDAAVSAIESVTDAVVIKLGQDVESDSGASLSGADITIDLNGHKLTAVGDGATEVINVSCGQTTITDTSDAKNGCIEATGDQKAVLYSSGKLIINAGIFNGKVGWDDKVPAAEYISISGGSFRQAENGEAAFALSDYLSSAKAELGQIDEVNYWVVTAGETPVTTAVAKIGDAEYTTLQAAVDAAVMAASETTIDICANITLTETLTIKGSSIEATKIIINNPEGKTVTFNGDANAMGVAIDDATVTFNGTGSWTRTSGTKTFFCFGESTDTTGANVIVNEGSYSVDLSSHVMNVAKGTLTINGGSFTTQKTDKDCVRAEVDGVLVVNGGVFTIPDGNNSLPIRKEGNGTITLNSNSKAQFTCSADAAKTVSGYITTEGYKLAKVGENTYYTIAAFDCWADYLGDADADGVYTIDDETDLLALQANAKTLGTSGITFKLMADIALTAAWKSVGLDKGDVYSFDGTFDGNGKTISNVVFADLSGLDAAANNYRGFFGKVGSTGVIKNLTVSGTGFGVTPPSGEYGCAMIVGELLGTLENCTAEGTITSGTHKVGGICVRLTGGTIKNCTNKVNVTGNYTKVGGVCVLSQGGGTIEGCVNEGSVTAANGTNAGRDGVGGIIAYVVSSSAVTVRNCTNKGVISKGEGAHECNAVGQIVGFFGGNSATAFVMDGENKVLPGYSTIGVTANTSDDAYKAGNVSGLNYAALPAVDDLVTLVKDDALAANTNYKVMAHGRTYTLATAESTVTFDESLNTVTVTLADSLTNDYEIAKAVVGEATDKVTTYSVAAKAVEPTYEPVEAGTTTQDFASEQAASAAATAINADKTTYITVPGNMTLEGEALTTYVNLFEATANGTKVTVDFTANAKSDLQTAVDDAVKTLQLQELAASDGTANVALLTIENATPGLFYTLLSGTETPASLPTVTSIQATSATVVFNVQKTSAKAFFKVEISAQKPAAAAEK